MKYEYDVFISYSRKDYDSAKKVTDILDAGGYTYFNDFNAIAVGEEYAQVISQAIDRSGIFVFIFSENASISRFALSELQYAFEHNKEIILIENGNSTLPSDLGFMLFSRYIRLDMSRPNFKETLLKRIGKILGVHHEKPLSEKQEKENIEAAEERRNGTKDYVPIKIDVDIFISYRRVDGRDYARNIMQALKISGYPKVFFDFNSLRDGVFNTQIIDAIYSCNDFILVISPLALKNCGREGDWVTKEIRLAMKYNKKIVPVVIEDTFTGWPSDFPQDLSPIKDIHFHKLMTDEYFEDSIEKLTKRLVTAVSTDKKGFIGLKDLQTTEWSQQGSVTYKIKIDRKCRLLIDDEEIQVIEANKLFKIPLFTGEYIRRVVAFDDETVFDETKLVLEHDKVDLVSLRRKKPFWKRLWGN